MVTFAFFAIESDLDLYDKGLVVPAPLRLIPLRDDQSQEFWSSGTRTLPAKQYVAVVDQLTLPSPTGLRPLMSVAISFGVIFLFLLCFLVNQMQWTPIHYALIYGGFPGI